MDFTDKRKLYILYKNNDKIMTTEEHYKLSSICHRNKLKLIALLSFIGYLNLMA